MLKDVEINKFFVFFLIFITTIPIYVNAFDSITAAATFNIQNNPPEVESINIKGNTIEIKVKDLNGYEDIIEVRAISNSFNVEAEFKSGKDLKAIYEAKINNLDEIEKPYNLNIEVTDNDNKASSNEMITGLTTVQTTGFSDSIIHFFKKIFSFFLL